MTTSKQQTTETPVIEGDRYAEPRERNEPGHKDAGQQYVDEVARKAELERDEREKKA